MNDLNLICVAVIQSLWILSCKNIFHEWNNNNNK